MIWDHMEKKPLRHYLKYALEMQDIRFNADGSRLAVGGELWLGAQQGRPINTFRRGVWRW